ncbi:MAG: zf-HC2 domain-containing protein [Bacteroidota bacterium]
MKNWISGRCPSGQVLTAYVEGSLSAQQTHRVEDHLLDCPLCTSAVEGLQQQQPRPEVVPQRSRQRKIWPVIASAAAVLLLLFAGWQYWQASEPERLFTAYFDPQPIYGYEQQRSLSPPRPDLAPSIQQQALKYHREGEYRLALTAWRAYFDEQPLPDSWLPQQYAATAALAVGLPEEAHYFLDQIPPDLSGTQREQVLWYRAMAHLKGGDQSAALMVLEDLMSAPQSIYGRELAVGLAEEIGIP